MKLRAIDVGFVLVKGIAGEERIELLLLGDFRPISGIKYVGKKFFIGEMARRQSQPRVTMGVERFINGEGMGLMLTMLAEEDHAPLIGYVIVYG